MSSLSRAFVSDIEVRSDGTGRTIHGIVVPFDRVARVSDGGPFYDEAFRRGAFKRTIDRGAVNRVKLLSHHNSRNNPLGRASDAREDASGLYGEFHVSKTAAGDEAIELVRDGALDSFSVGFSGIQQEQRDGVMWRTEVAWREASLVTFPAYADALIGGVRALLAADEPDPKEIERLAALLGPHILRISTPAEDPLDRDTSESPEPVTAEDDPDSAATADHSLTQAMFRFRAMCAERGL